MKNKKSRRNQKLSKNQNESFRKILPVYDTKEFSEAHFKQVLKTKKQQEKYKLNDN